MLASFSSRSMYAVTAFTLNAYTWRKYIDIEQYSEESRLRTSIPTHTALDFHSMTTLNSIQQSQYQSMLTMFRMKCGVRHPFHDFSTPFMISTIVRSRVCTRIPYLEALKRSLLHPRVLVHELQCHRTLHLPPPEQPLGALQPPQERQPLPELVSPCFAAHPNRVQFRCRSC